MYTGIIIFANRPEANRSIADKLLQSDIWADIVKYTVIYFQGFGVNWSNSTKSS